MPTNAMEIGSKIAHYEILGQLGAGGMGEVYRARDTRLDRTVAVKILPSELSEQSTFRRRFEREAKAVAALSHPNILAIYDYGEHEGVIYTASELLEGESLRERLIEGRIPQGKAADFARQIAQGLAAAHDKGIVHRDLKPGNIFITRDGHIKILDFGLAKARAIDDPAAIDQDSQADAKTQADQTAPGMVLGTAGYMAPEQVRGQEADHRSDIFALGAVLYEMITGERAFQGDSSVETMSAILTQEPRQLSVSSGKVPPGLGRIVRRCLEKKSDERFQSARDLGFALEAVSEPGLRAAVPVPTAAQADTVGTASGESATDAASGPSASIAVLPFVNMSPDPENEYFTDGITEEIINALSQLEDLRVAARTSSFAFKGQVPDIAEVGAKLNVSTVLSGSVRRAGKRLRITAQLINVDDGYQLWSERYDREMADIFVVQDEITEAIVDALQVRLIGEREGELVKRHTENLEAYELYLKGRHFWHQRTPEALKTSVKFFERAIELDPSYALPYTGMADAHSIQRPYGVRPASEIEDTAKKAVAKALEIDDGLAEAHYSAGLAKLYFDEDWPEAEHSFRRATEINPRYAIAQGYLGLSLAMRGRFDEAAGPFAVSLELDPLSPLLNSIVGLGALIADDNDRCLEFCERALEIDPDFLTAMLGGPASLCRLGKHERAVRMAERGVSASKRVPFVMGTLGLSCALAGRQEEAREVLDELAERERQGEYIAPQGPIMVYVGLGDRDKVYEWLEKCLEDRTPPLALAVTIKPFLDEMRSDPRIEEVLTKRMRLPRPAAK